MKSRKWLTELRNALGLTQQAVADKAEIDRSFYTQIETGLRNPSVETAKKISNTLGFNWTIFFDDKGGNKQLNSTINFK